jgi:uncharacterized protein YbjT (DUF2867 family)
MKVAVVGGTGVLGTLLVRTLAGAGHEVLALSRRAPRELPAGATHMCIDLTDGHGLEATLAGVEVVVDCSNSNPRNAAPVLVEGTKRLLPAGVAAGVRHHVGVSIVGCDRVPTAYYKVKVEQEETIAAGELPWSLVRATQFHTLIAWAFGQAGRFGVVPTGRAQLQPVDPGVVADRLAAIVAGEPGGRLGDVAGPEVLTLSELARAWKRAGHRALPLRIPMLGRIGRPVKEGALCAPSAAGGGTTFEEWLARG